MNAAGELATLARVGASLVVVIVLAALAARLARRAGGRGPGVGLRVLDRAGLSREAAVAVVEVAGRGLVLGVTTRAVSVLTELDAEQLAAAQAEHGRTAPLPGRGAGAAVRIVASTDPGRVTDPARSPGGPAVRRWTGSAGRARPGIAGTGAILDPRTWRQGIEALRELTVRRG